jgi:16S rRNA (adenine1518-N6/adenine1519-N6)-dimethyltransferase
LPACPDSKDAIRAALERLGLRPHKRFGQNLLGDAAVLDRIVAASGVGPRSVVLEVGPGLGALTERLLAAGAAVVAVEIDRGLVRALRESLAAKEPLVLLEADVMGAKGRLADAVGTALRDEIARAGAAGFEVVSNLPYGLSSPFLASLVAPPGPPLRATLMLQDEFADVLVARPSTEAYSALSVFVQTFFEVRRAFGVGRSAFHPAPDVDSAVVALVPREAPAPAPDAFGGFVRRLFQGRRKALGTTVGPVLGMRSAGARAWLAEAGFDPLARVEALPPPRIVALFEAVISSQA